MARANGPYWRRRSAINGKYTAEFIKAALKMLKEADGFILIAKKNRGDIRAMCSTIDVTHPTEVNKAFHLTVMQLPKFCEEQNRGVKLEGEITESKYVNQMNWRVVQELREADRRKKREAVKNADSE